MLLFFFSHYHFDLSTKYSSNAAFCSLCGKAFLSTQEMLSPKFGIVDSKDDFLLLFLLPPLRGRRSRYTPPLPGMLLMKEPRASGRLEKHPSSWALVKSSFKEGNNWWQQLNSNKQVNRGQRFLAHSLPFYESEVCATAIYVTQTIIPHLLYHNWTSDTKIQR